MLTRRQFFRLGSQYFTACTLSQFAIQQTSASNQPLLRPILEKARRKFGLPAMAAAVICKGSVIEHATVGYRKNGASISAQENDQFHLASCTKAMTATLIGQLVDHNKLDWSSTLVSIFPELSKHINQPLQNATVEMLLSHRAGLSTSAESLIHSEKLLKLNSSSKQRYEFTRLALATPPSGAPGQRFAYSNAGYILLGAILEKVSGVPWENTIKTKLFSPLGMSTAGFGAMGIASKIVEPFQHQLVGNSLVPVAPGSVNSDNPPYFAPAGGVHCSIGDWAKFVLLHLGYFPELKIVTPKTIERLHNAPFGGDYMGGWSIHTRIWAKATVLSHTGSNNLSYAEVWMVPSKKFAVLVATNAGGDEALKACDEVCSALVKHYL